MIHIVPLSVVSLLIILWVGFVVYKFRKGKIENGSDFAFYAFLIPFFPFFLFAFLLLPLLIVYIIISYFFGHYIYIYIMILWVGFVVYNFFKGKFKGKFRDVHGIIDFTMDVLYFPSGCILSLFLILSALYALYNTLL